MYTITTVIDVTVSECCENTTPNNTSDVRFCLHTNTPLLRLKRPKLPCEKAERSNDRVNIVAVRFHLM